MKLAISAGFDKSLPALLMAERLRRSGHEIVAALVVSPFRLSRVVGLLLSRGADGLRRAVAKLLRGTERADAEGLNAVEALAAEIGIEHRSMRAWSNAHGVMHRVVGSLNDDSAVDAIKSAGAQALIYGGGGILRAPVIEAVDGCVVNPHAGPLPEVRGMNAIEWATLLGERQCVTVHYIDVGIDTGELLAESPVPVDARDTVESLRSKAVATGVRALTDLLDGVDHPAQLVGQQNPGVMAGRQCFSMSPALKELVARRLAVGAGGTSRDGQRSHQLEQQAP